MSDALLISNVFLWLVVLALLLVVWALARQIGVLYERVAPMGALMIDQGPKVGRCTLILLNIYWWRGRVDWWTTRSWPVAVFLVTYLPSV